MHHGVYLNVVAQPAFDLGAEIISRSFTNAGYSMNITFMTDFSSQVAKASEELYIQFTLLLPGIIFGHSIANDLSPYRLVLE